MRNLQQENDFSDQIKIYRNVPAIALGVARNQIKNAALANMNSQHERLDCVSRQRWAEVVWKISYNFALRSSFGGVGKFSPRLVTRSLEPGTKTLYN